MKVAGVRRLYTTCMDTEAIEERSVTDLQDILARLGGWPVVQASVETNIRIVFQIPNNIRIRLRVKITIRHHTVAGGQLVGAIQLATVAGQGGQGGIHQPPHLHAGQVTVHSVLFVTLEKYSL